MAATQQVVIKLTTTGNTRQIKQHRNELIRLAAAGKIANQNGVTLSKTFEKLDRRMNTFKGTVLGVGRVLGSLNKIALALFGIGFAIGAASLTLVNALFATGRVVANLYKTTMQALAAVVAAVGAALAGAAAAMREYTAAVQAYAFKSSPALNNRLFESRAALRGLQDDAVLATFGVQALNQAFANIAKNTQVTAVSRNLLKGLADFASAGGDPAQNLAAAAEFVGLLQKAGRLDQKALAAAEALGPTFVDALKKARSQGVSTLGDLSKMIQSGELSRLGGVEGQAAIVGGTLLGQFKAMFMELNVMAADFGQSLLGPVKEAMQEIGKLVQRLFMRVGPEMIGFGRGGALNAIVRAFEKLEDFSVHLFRKYLPGANGMMARFANWWRRVVYWYKDFVDRLRGLLPLGSAVIEAFGKPFMAIFETVGNWIRYIGESIKKNQAAYNSFGNTLLEFVRKIQEIGRRFIDTFSEALPFLEQMVGFIMTAVDGVMGLATAFGFVADILGNIVGLLGGRNEGLGSFISMLPFLFLFGPGGRRRRGKAGGMVGGAINRMMHTGMLGPIAVTGAARQRQAAAQAQAAQAAQGIPTIPGLPLQVPVVGPSSKYPQSRTRRLMYRAGQGMGNMMKPEGFMGSMAPGMLMMLGSAFASREAQMPLMAGGALASLAPAFGVAAPYVALAGLGLGGLGAATTAQTEAGGAGMGALGGASLAGGGALLGLKLGIIGGPMGVVIGALLGAAAGAVYGYFKGKSNKDKKQAKEAASEYMNNVYGDVSEGLILGDASGVRARLERMRADVNRISEIAGLAEGSGRVPRMSIYGQELQAGRITKAEYDALVSAPGTYRRELEKSAYVMEGVLIPMLDRFDDTARIAKKSLGMTTDELVRLANETGVNLFDSTVSLTDKLKQLGLAVQYTADQIVGAMRDIQVEGIERLQGGINRMFSGQAMDEMTEALYQQAIESGNVPLTELSKYVSDVLNQFNIQDPNSPLMNVQRLLNTFGRNGIIFREGMQLEGLAFVFEPIQNLLEELGKTTAQRGAESLTDMIAKQALFAGIAVDRGQLSEILGNKTLGELDVIMKKLADGTLSVDQLIAEGRDIKGLRSRSMVAGAFGQLGLENLSYERIDQSAMTLEQLTMLYGEEGAAILTGMNRVIEAAFTNKPDWMKTPPDWYTKESFQAILNADDTSTPRGVGDTVTSRLGRTMSRHNYFDSMFSGKRNVTSSFRTFGLGSINSDHITGRAYDLTGDNLGAYATMVNRMGGFAEFHGVGGARHLHVVPGETPVGDSTAPYMSTGVTPVVGGSTSNTYNVVVNAAPGMDVNSLANAVMERIQRVERQNAERS
jgi:hypothetical protein